MFPEIYEKQNIPHSNSNYNFTFILFMMRVIVAVFGIGYASGQGKLKIGNTTITINRGGPSTSADYSLLWEALDLVNEKYVNRPLDQQKLLYMVRAVCSLN